MKYGFINRNITDLRKAPKFESERLSQVLFNDVVNITSVRNGYAKVRQSDGYSGWVRQHHITYISQIECRRYWQNNNYNYIITVPTSKIAGSIGKELSFLFYSTRLNVIDETKSRYIIETPDRKTIGLQKRGLDLYNTIDIAGNKLIAEFKKFLGVPYLWGGITPFGFDCSGLVWSVFRRFGHTLPRDSKDQRKVGVEIDRSEIKAGDLLFFPGHIAIALDNKRIIHASSLEGGVAMNSMVPGDKYRPDLDKSFICARRVLK